MTTLLLAVFLFAAPQLARILSTHHGFKTTVLFALDPDGGGSGTEG